MYAISFYLRNFYGLPGKLMGTITEELDLSVGNKRVTYRAFKPAPFSPFFSPFIVKSTPAIVTRYMVRTVMATLNKHGWG
jgi:hypothetical protein